MSCENCRKIEEEEEGAWEPDCAKCNLPSLYPGNCEAVRLYSLLTSGFVRDTGTWELVMTAYKPRLTRIELRELIDKMIIIHDVMTESRETNAARD